MPEKEKHWLPNFRQIPIDETIRQAFGHLLVLIFGTGGILSLLASIFGKVPELTSVGWLAVFLGSSLGVALVWVAYEWASLMRHSKKLAQSGTNTFGFFAGSVRGPNIAATPQPILTKNFYSKLDKDRIADALSEFSNVINREGVKLLVISQKTMRAAQQGSEADMRDGLNDFGQRLLGLSSDLFGKIGGILSINQAYASDLDIVFTKNELQQLLSRMNNNIHRMTSAHMMLNKLDSTVVEFDRQNFKYALQVFSQNMHNSLAEFGRWRLDFETRRDKVLAMLAQSDTITNPPV